MQHQAFFNRSRRIFAVRHNLFLVILAATCASAFGDFATSSFPGLSRERSPSIFEGFGLLGRGNHGGDSGNAIEDPFLSSSPESSLDHRTDNMTSTPSRSAKIPNVVRVVVENGNELSLGSGTLVGVNDEHGFIVTNWHVVEDANAENCFVDFPDGFRSGATVMKTDEQWDLALLLIWKPNVEPMPLSPDIPQAGERLTIAGYGQGPFRTEPGRMTDFVAPNETAPFEMIEIEATARQGDSGGPMINSHGELAAVLFGSGAGRTTGTHIDRVRRFLDSAFGAPPPGLDPNTAPPGYGPDQQIAMNGMHQAEQTALHEPFAAQQPYSGPPDQPPIDIQNPPGSMANALGGNALAALPGAPPPQPSPSMTPEEMRRNSLAALRNIPMARNPLGYDPADVPGGNPNWQQHPLDANREFANFQQGNPRRSSPFGFFAIVGIFAAGFLFLPRGGG